MVILQIIIILAVVYSSWFAVYKAKMLRQVFREQRRKSSSRKVQRKYIKIRTGSNIYTKILRLLFDRKKW